MPPKRNFYKNVLLDAEQHLVAPASSVNGLDDEIILLRVRIKTLMAANPRDYAEILQTTALLARLEKVRSSDPLRRQKNITQDVQSVLKEIALPLKISLYDQEPARGDRPQ